MAAEGKGVVDAMSGNKRRNREDWPLFLKAEEAAELLRIHPQTVYELARCGKLPARNVGRAVRIDRDALFDQFELDESKTGS